MGIRFPVPLGSMSGLTGESLLVEAESVLRPNYGDGVYSEHDESAHWYYRRGASMGPALTLAQMCAMQRNAIPDFAIMFLSEWETVLGIPSEVEDADEHDAWTLEARWSRIRARILEAEGPTAAGIDAALTEAFDGEFSFQVYDMHEAGIPVANTCYIRVPDDVEYTGWRINIVHQVMARVCPAHVAWSHGTAAP